MFDLNLLVPSRVILCYLVCVERFVTIVIAQCALLIITYSFFVLTFLGECVISRQVDSLVRCLASGTSCLSHQVVPLVKLLLSLTAKAT